MRPLLPGRAVLLPAVVVARLPADDTRSGGGIPRLLPPADRQSSQNAL